MMALGQNGEAGLIARLQHPPADVNEIEKAHSCERACSIHFTAN
jgi:hypothetical protein